MAGPNRRFRGVRTTHRHGPSYANLGAGRCISRTLISAQQLSFYKRSVWNVCRLEKVKREGQGSAFGHQGAASQEARPFFN